jgi:DNA-binding protein YbaB
MEAVELMGDNNMGENTIWEVPLESWFVISAILFVMIFSLWIAAIVRIGKLKKRLQRFVKDTGMPDLDSVMGKLHDQMKEMTAQAESQRKQLEALEKKTSSMKANMGMVRYNAFGDHGRSDLSFSLAILNDNQEGVVISSLHSRDESRVYAKQVEGGASTSYPLTPEEKECITQATRKL